MRLERLFIDCIPLLAAMVGMVNTVVKFMLNHKKSPEEAFKFLDKKNRISQMEKINKIENELEELRNEIESLKERIK